MDCKLSAHKVISTDLLTHSEFIAFAINFLFVHCSTQLICVTETFLVKSIVCSYNCASQRRLWEREIISLIYEQG